MARNPREFEDLLKLPPEERLRLANWLIDSATNGERGGSGPHQIAVHGVFVKVQAKH
jgi:hypothetical protein